jgi:TrmH family RNA methyltransferase
MQAEKITSLQNPRVKRIVKLRDRRPRDEAGVFLIEGYRQIRRALEKDIVLSELYFSPDWFLGENEPALIGRAAAAGAALFELSKEAFAKVAYRERPDGLLATAPQWRRTLAELDALLDAKYGGDGGAGGGGAGGGGAGADCGQMNLPVKSGDESPHSKDAAVGASAAAADVAAATSAAGTGAAAAGAGGSAPFLLVVEAVEKPGNLGTILRSADAAGVGAVIVCDPVTDIFNPNVVRSSTGVLFSVPVVVTESGLARAWLRARGIRAVATTPSAGALYTGTDLRGPLAIVMGGEQYGLSDFWLRESDARVRIPMAGQADSLNVAMATIITLFEAVRQRS